MDLEPELPTDDELVRALEAEISYPLSTLDPRRPLHEQGVDSLSLIVAVMIVEDEFGASMADVSLDQVSLADLVQRTQGQ